MTNEQTAPLTDEELVGLRKRVTYQIDSAAENNETWIDGEIWQKTLARLATAEKERDDPRGADTALTGANRRIEELLSMAEQRRAIFDEALEHLKAEPVHLVLFTTNIQLRKQLSDARELVAQIIATVNNRERVDLLAQLRTVLK